MKISHRAEAITPFLAMEFGKRAAALEAAGRHIVKLNIGEPDFGAPPAVTAAMRAQMDGRPQAYTGALGLPELRDAIAGFYATAHGIRVDPAQVVVTAGASAALLMVAAALVNPGDRVLVADPSYPCNRHFLAGFGADVALVPTSAATRFQLDLASVQAHWTANSRGVLVASPSNPTGTSVPAAELAALCRWVARQGGWRVVDEIYLNLADRAADGTPAQTVLAVDPQAVVINSFSKYWGMTGWRLGWCVAPPALLPALERLAQNYYICPSVPAQNAALACFTADSLAACESRRLELQARRALVTAGLASIGLPVPVQPDGAFYVYFDVQSTGMDALQFCERALMEVGVALTPGADFGTCSAATHVRLSYATSRNELDQGLLRLGQLLQQG